MKRDVILGVIGVIASSYFIFRSYYNSRTSYKKFEISPSVYKPIMVPVDTKKIVKVAEVRGSSKTYDPPYTTSIDLPTYKDAYTIDTYMELPLETEGKTFSTSNLYKDIEETPTVEPMFIKYLRFQCTETRGERQGTVHIGGFRFFQDLHASSKKPIDIWNPHTGISEKYTQGSWSDSDQRMVVFRFSEAVLVTRYELKSSTESMEYDPIHWRLEGSMTGAFWTILDDRTTSETAFPTKRQTVAKYIVRGRV